MYIVFREVAGGMGNAVQARYGRERDSQVVLAPLVVDPLVFRHQSSSIGNARLGYKGDSTDTFTSPSSEKIRDLVRHDER